MFVEGFACFIRMDLLQLANTCGLQDGKSFNFNDISWQVPQPTSWVGWGTWLGSVQLHPRDTRILCPPMSDEGGCPGNPILGIPILGKMLKTGTHRKSQHSGHYEAEQTFSLVLSIIVIYCVPVSALSRVQPGTCSVNPIYSIFFAVVNIKGWIYNNSLPELFFDLPS